MSEQAHPNLANELKKYGLIDYSACYHCGHCTGTCSLTSGENAFPRKAIKLIQLGLKDKLEECLEPWLCYYCGDCSSHCPRGANPAEAMMTLRRFLTARYDWTRLGRRLYTSKAFEIFALLAVALVVVAFFVVPHMMFPGHFEPGLLQSPEGHMYVPLNKFAPVEWVHLGDWILAGILSFLLLSNVLSMFLKVKRGDKGLKIPLFLYIKNAFALPLHFVTQKRLIECKDKKVFWGIHAFLMSGYIIMFTLVVVLLPYFQIDEEGWNWTTVLGYYATVALLIGIVAFAIGRFKKREEIHKHSHFSDWMFLILLFLTVTTGIAVHIVRFYLLMPIATYVIYALHLAIAVAMLMVEVPFSKWAHMAYRPMAMYLSAVRDDARKMRDKETS